MALSIEQQLALRHVEAYDLPTFLQGVEQAVKDGYEICLEHNETYPYGTIGHYIVKMPKGQGSALEGFKTTQEASESTSEGVGSQEVNKETVEAPKKAGRKAKVIE